MTKTRDKRKRIVIAENDAITRQWMRNKIEELETDWEIDGVFADGSQALEYIRARGADVLLADVQMPVMDGLELLERLRDDGLEPYKVLFGGSGRFDDVRQVLRLGGHDFVLKSELTGESLRRILTEAGEWLRKRPEGRDGTHGRGAGFAGSGKQRELELHLKRLAEGSGEEAVLARYAAERSVDLRRLLFVNLYFGKEVPRDTVREFLYLYLEQEGRKGDCFSCGSQEFSMIYNQNNEMRVMNDLNRLQAILQAQFDAPLYVGVSGGALKAGNPASSGNGGNGGTAAAENLAELYRQASAARENRRFFGIQGCVHYGRLLISASAERREPGRRNFSLDAERIVTMLDEQRYEEALNGLNAFLTALRDAVTFHPAYVQALGNRILSAYLREARRYPLDENERKDLDGIELWLGWPASDLEEMGRALLRVAAYLDELLRGKSRSRSYTPAVRQVMQFVRENYGRKITLDEAASHVHLSRAYLSALFKKETGQNFSLYLQEVRLEAARSLMDGRELNIQEIADRTGFFDAPHLSRAFKARYGRSPLEYRKETRYKRQQPDTNIMKKFSEKQIGGKE